MRLSRSHNNPLCLVPLAATLWLLPVSTAHARADALAQCSGKYVRVIIDEPTGGSVKILVNPHKITTLQFQTPVTKTAHEAGQLYVDRVTGSRIDIKLLSAAVGEDLNSFQVHTPEHPISLVFEYTKDAARVPGVMEVVTRTQVERERHERLMNALQLLVESRDLLLPGGRIARNRAALKAAAEEQRTYAEIAHAPRTDRERYFVFDVFNHTTRYYELDAVQLIVGGRTTIDIDAVYLNRPGEPERGIHSIIPPGERARGAIQLPPEARDVGIGDVSLALYELRGGLPLTATTQTTRKYEIAPITEHELLLRQRDREARGRITLQVQPMYGAIWLANPLVSEQLDAASITGVSVRVAYGFNRYLAVEAGFAGASTGGARFADMTFQNMEGSLIRSATLGRAQFGGLLQLGQRVVPNLRVGIGMQGSDHSSRFQPTEGDDMLGPEVGFEFNVLGYVGFGLDVRLGNWLIGGAVTSTVALQERGRSLEAGLHIGYGWQPRSSKR